jgi:hypothetical protein
MGVWGRLFVGLGVLVVLLIVCLLLTVLDFPVVAMRSERVAAEYRAAGLPWDASDLDRGVAVADNADPTFLAEVSSNRYMPWDAKAVLRIETLLKDRDFRGARQELDGLSDSLAKFELASRAKAIAIKKDWEQGGGVAFPEFPWFRGATKLFCARAELKVQSGDLEGGLEDLGIAHRLAVLIGEEQTLIAALVSVACQRIVADRVLTVASLCCDDAVRLKRIKDVVRSWPLTKVDLKNAMQAEYHLGLWVARNLSSSDLLLKGGSDVNFFSRRGKSVSTGFGEGVVRRAYQTRLMEAYLEVKKIIDSEKDPIAVGRRIDDFVMAQDGPGLSDRIIQVVFPVFVNAGIAVERVRREPSVVLAGIAALEFHLARGRYPKTWAELGVRPVEDVDTGKDMIMRAEGKFFAIYSVGPNKADDGGIDRTGKRLKDDRAYVVSVR